MTAALKRLPEAVTLHSTNGRWDLVVSLAAEDLRTLDRVLDAIRNIPGVSHSETSILLSEI